MKKIATIFILLLLPLLAVGQVAVYDTVTIDSIQYVPDPLVDNASPRSGDTVVVRLTAYHGPRDISSGARWAFNAFEGTGGPWHSIQVIQHDTSSANAVNTGMGFVLPGDEYYITGVVEEFSGGTQLAVLIDPNHYPTIISDSNPIVGPFVVPTGDLQDAANGEQWEGSYVRVEGAEVINNSLPFRECSIDDGSGPVELSAWFLSFRDSLDNSFYQYPANGAQINAEGFVRDAYANFTINPHYTNQIQELTFPPTISDVARNPIVPTSSEAVDVSAKVIDGNGTVAGVTLWYSVDNGSYSSIPMTTSDSVYTGQIPAQANDLLVKYYISSIDNDGHQSQSPGDTSQSTYFYFVRDAGMSIADIQFTPFSDGNSGLLGQTVTISGVVMTDTLESTAYYWIQDSDQPWHGIRVRDSENGPNKGDMVEVTGEVQESNLVTRINNLSGYSVLSTGNALWAPRPTTVDEVNAGGALLEAMESVFLKLTDLTVTNEFPDGSSNFGEFSVSDATGEIRVDDYFFPYRGQQDSLYELGATIDSMYGFGYYSFSNPKIIPRGDYDVFGLSTTIRTLDNAVPHAFALEQNYPNPFNPSTSIRFSIPSAERVVLKIYNMLGQEVASLMDMDLQPGSFEVNWNGLNNAGNQISTGVYFYRLEAGKNVSVKKMMLIR